MAIETEVEMLRRHLKDFRQFEFEERTLRERYEKALKEIDSIEVTTLFVAQIIAKKALSAD